MRAFLWAVLAVVMLAGVGAQAADVDLDITITVPDAFVARMTDYVNNGDPSGEAGATPKAKLQAYLKRYAVRFLREELAQYERQKATDALESTGGVAKEE